MQCSDEFMSSGNSNLKEDALENTAIGGGGRREKLM